MHVFESCWLPYSMLVQAPDGMRAKLFACASVAVSAATIALVYWDKSNTKNKFQQSVVADVERMLQG